MAHPLLFRCTGRKGDDEGLKKMVAERLAEIDARAVNSIRSATPAGAGGTGRRFGPYVQEGEGTGIAAR